MGVRVKEHCSVALDLVLTYGQHGTGEPSLAEALEHPIEVLAQADVDGLELAPARLANGDRRSDNDIVAPKKAVAPGLVHVDIRTRLGLAGKDDVAVRAEQDGVDDDLAVSGDDWYFNAGEVVASIGER